MEAADPPAAPAAPAAVIQLSDSRHLTGMPDEVLRLIFSGLDAVSLAAVSQTASHMRKIALERVLWKRLVIKLHGKSAISQVSDFGNCWRRMFVEKPRIRFDGFYMARVSYVRAGQTEGHHNQPFWYVAYHRFLRFLPGGRVLSIMTPEKPSEAVRLLTPRDKRVLIGSWTLNPSRPRSKDLPPDATDDDLSGRPCDVHVVIEQRPGPAIITYNLDVDGTAPGLHNRLVVQSHFFQKIDEETPSVIRASRGLKFKFVSCRECVRGAEAHVAVDGATAAHMDRSMEPY